MCVVFVCTLVWVCVCACNLCGSVCASMWRCFHVNQCVVSVCDYMCVSCWICLSVYESGYVKILSVWHVCVCLCESVTVWYAVCGCMCLYLCVSVTVPALVSYRTFASHDSGPECSLLEPQFLICKMDTPAPWPRRSGMVRTARPHSQGPGPCCVLCSWGVAAGVLPPGSYSPRPSYSVNAAHFFMNL